MVPIAVGNVIQATVEGVNEGVPWAWVSHWRVSATAAAADWFTGLQAYIISYLTALAPLLNDEWEAQCIKFSRVAPQPMGVIYSEDSFPIPGEVATDGIPTGSAALIRFESAEVGAGGRGRWFLTGVPEASTNGGRLTASAQTALQAAMGGYSVGFTTGGEAGIPVVFSRALYGTDPPGHPAAVADYTADINGTAVQANLASQRRRRYPRNAPAA